MKYNRKHIGWIILFGIVLIGFLIVTSVLNKPDTSTYKVLWVQNNMGDIPMIEKYQDSSAPENATVTFNGVTYTGSYLKTYVEFPLTYRYHVYDGNGYEFSINCDTGELCSFYRKGPPPGISTVDKSYCRQLADSIADDYFDLGEYSIKEEVKSLNDGSNFLYTCTYYKDFNDYETPDRFWISVNGNGQVEYFTIYGAGSFADVKRVSVNKRKAKEAIQAKLEEIYVGTTVPVEDFVIKRDEWLIRLEDGSCAVYYDVVIKEQELLTFAVKVDYKKK